MINLDKSETIKTTERWVVYQRNMLVVMLR